MFASGISMCHRVSGSNSIATCSTIFGHRLTHGKARSRYADGRVVEVSYQPGDTKHLQFRGGRTSHGMTSKISVRPRCNLVTVEFKDSGNAALPV